MSEVRQSTEGGEGGVSGAIGSKHRQGERGQWEEHFPPVSHPFRAAPSVPSLWVHFEV